MASEIKKKSIVIFSSDDWGWKTSKYQLSIRFSQSRKVLFVSSIGFRAPKASAEDFLRIIKKITAFFRGVKKIEDNLFVLTPLAIPFAWFPWREKANRIFVRAQLWFSYKKLGIKSKDVFVFSQNWYPIVESIKCEKLVYYCVDEQSGFEGLDKNLFHAQDLAMCQLADLIFCSSKLLCERKSIEASNVHHMPHGVNYQHFHRAIDEKLQEPKDIADITGKRILFFGHISYDWVDAALLKYIAKQRLNFSILLVGRYSMQEDEFVRYSNIHVLGEKGFEVLPAYCQYAHVGIIPFVESELTKNCNPLKLPEYAAAGLPVVSTDIPEVAINTRHAHVAFDKQQFLAHLDDSVKDVEQLAAKGRAAELAGATWDHRISAIYQLLES